jgi:hypothetical protein
MSQFDQVFLSATIDAFVLATTLFLVFIHD